MFTGMQNITLEIIRFALVMNSFVIPRNIFDHFSIAMKNDTIMIFSAGSSKRTTEIFNLSNYSENV